MKYKKYVLDKFQEKAIESINKNHSVVVSAATGTGKDSLRGGRRGSVGGGHGAAGPGACRPQGGAAALRGQH